MPSYLAVTPSLCGALQVPPERRVQSSTCSNANLFTAGNCLARPTARPGLLLFLREALQDLAAAWKTPGGTADSTVLNRT